MPDWIARKDTGLREQSLVFSQRVDSDPSAYGISPEQSAHLVLRQSEFAAALQLVMQNSTNSTAARADKDEARARLVAVMRTVGGIARAHPGVGEPQLVALQMKPRASRRTRVAGPISAPAVEIIGVVRRTVKVRLIDPAHPTRKAKPRDVIAAVVHGFAGEHPPESIGQWKLLGNRTETTFEVEFNDPEIKSGDTVWITATWLGTRLQPSFGAVPVSTQVYGPPMMKLKVLAAHAA